LENPAGEEVQEEVGFSTVPTGPAAIFYLFKSLLKTSVKKGVHF